MQDIIFSYLETMMPFVLSATLKVTKTRIKELVYNSNMSPDHHIINKIQLNLK
jgi:hypothetical protein